MSLSGQRYTLSREIIAPAQGVRVAEESDSKLSEFSPERRSDADLLNGESVASNGFADKFATEGGPSVEAPEIRDVKVSRLSDLGEGKELSKYFRELGMPSSTAQIIQQFSRLRAPGVITMVHDQGHQLGTLAPILDPDCFRVITAEMVQHALQITSEEGAFISRAIGSTALLYNPQTPEARVGLYEGVFDVTTTNFGRRHNIQDQSDVVVVDGDNVGPIADKGFLPKGFLVEAANYPLRDKTEERNQSAVLISLSGKNLTPEAITVIAREIGIEGAMGMIVTTSGRTKLSASHGLPNEKIEIPDLQRLIYKHSVLATMVGVGTVSDEEPHSKWGHVHTDQGHLVGVADGKMWALVYPAQRELVAEYR